jgi:nitrite reductase/ring-hydroxylating ferredoxin subunit
MSRVTRFVEKVLRQRRIRRVRIDPESDAELRTAILLRSARLGAGSVREEFVTSLQQRLGAELAGQTPIPVARRRRFVQLAATAAASIGVGVGLDRVLTSATAAGPTTEKLSPDHGIWHTVAASDELPEGGVLRFDVGTVTGFVRRAGGQVAAVSGICTHLGCRLNLDVPARQLDCPCHGASFSVTGTVLRHRLPIALAPLPVIQVRETNGVVQVFA